jgi:hypothetical protein
LEEWPVSYHGIGKDNGMNIAEVGFKLNENKQFLLGQCIYTTFDLEIAKLYATKFEYEGQAYFILLQNRVNSHYLEMVNEKEPGHGTYWISNKSSSDTSDDDISDMIRPYGICIFKA